MDLHHIRRVRDGGICHARTASLPGTAGSCTGCSPFRVAAWIARYDVNCNAYAERCAPRRRREETAM
jgi:hypothetical protein